MDFGVGLRGFESNRSVPFCNLGIKFETAAILPLPLSKLIDLILQCQTELRYAKMGETQQALRNVTDLINSPGASGRNCVDFALASKVSLAMYLQDCWGGRPNKPPPAKFYDQDTRWRSHNC